MPLLHKKPFVPLGTPQGLGKNDTVFFCKLTKEMFTDYDEFCERIILCNSLVWSCSLTGRSNLTFQEASSSEERCKRLLKKFPVELRVPVLYLASLCERRSLLDLTEDVFCYVKDRYFVGETVQTNLPDNPEANCKILSVSSPTEEELDSCPKSDKDQNGERQYWPPGSLYRYRVRMEEGGEESSVSGAQLFRKKSLYNKDKNRLYIKQFVHLSHNFWKIKDVFNKKYGISDVKYSDIFCGPPPVLSQAKAAAPKKTPKNGKQRQETLNKYFKPSPDKRYSSSSPKKSSSPRKEGSASKLSGVKQKRKRRSKAEVLAAKELKVEDQEAKMKAKLERKEEKMKLAKFIKEWARKREDLECEDLRELPQPLPVCSRIPQEYFGDAIMVMEFLHTFTKLLPVKDFFPYGLNLELIERALVDDEIAGPFADLTQLLLVSVMDLMDQENEEVKETDVKISGNLVLEKGGVDTQSVLRQANKAVAWARRAHAGQALGALTLDSSTLTEVTRLHLLSSGARPGDRIAKWRYQARGGYCTYDDPAVQLKLSDPNIIHQLGRVSVCELPIGDKVKLVNCLMNQILTYSTLRDTLDDAWQKGKQAKLELRNIIAQEQKTEKELKKKAKETEGGGANGEVEDGNPRETEVSRVLRGHGAPESGGSTTKQDLSATYNAAMELAHHVPLGEDRAYRKYWAFSSLPGLYVEHYELNPGPCLPKGTPVWRGTELKDDNVEALVKLFKSYGPNKENVSDLLSYPYSANNHFSPSKKLLTENNGVHPLPPQGVGGETKGECSRLTCWGDASVCPVHGPESSLGGPRWYFFKDRGDVERLLERLNSRGVRERNLLASLTSRKEHIIESLQRVPLEFLVKTEESLENNEKIISKMGRQYENANMSFPLGTPHYSILESLLREQILEAELKISAGGLGYLKVKSREAWRTAIESNSYDRQCKKLTWGLKASQNKENSIGDDGSNEEGTRKDEGDSRCSTPVSSLDEDEEKPLPQVLDLASAILQLEQSIDQRFLKRPLGLDQKERDKGQLKMPTPALEQWETALMQATSFSQLFLYFSSLDNSILWARSALNAFCRICRRKNNPENMLLCDTCNKGHHLYCLKPKLTKIPSGDWHCNDCRPKVSKVSSPVKKKRRVFKEEDSEDSESEEEEEEEADEEESMECCVCNETGAELECGTCESVYHLACHNPPIRKAPKSKWFCQGCRQAGANLNSSSGQGAAPASPRPHAQPRRSAQQSNPSTPRIEVDEGWSASEDIDPEEDGDFAGFGAAEVEASERKRKQRCLHPNLGPSPTSERALHPSLGPSPTSEGVSPTSERSSRRQSSKTASERIHRFAKQLRSSAFDDSGTRTPLAACNPLVR